MERKSMKTRYLQRLENGLRTMRYFLRNQSGDIPVFILQLALFIFFGGMILYLIVLSFKLLAKFIVVPIKNVQYMLEGINIGGEFRLEYLKNLKKKQENK